MRARRHTAADYLTLATGYANEHVNGVLSNVTDRLEFIDEYLTTGDSRPRLQQLVRTLFTPLYREIGFTSNAADNDERRALRATLIHSLGLTGGDAEIAANAREALTGALAGGAPLDPTLARSIITVAARHGDAALFDSLLAASEKSTSGDEKYRYLYSLAEFRAPALLERALAYSLTNNLRSQDTASYLARFIGDETARPRAWAFAKEHWKELEPKVAIFGGDTTFVGSLSAFCDASTRDDITSFFAQHPLPSAARMLTQTVERINNCIVLREAQTPVVADFLQK